MAVVLSFISAKGGVGKTTTCYHIGIALKRYHEKAVLVVDADYQRGGITGRLFPALIETFHSGQISGTTLFHKYQQLYSADQQTSSIDIRTPPLGVDVIVADPRLATITVDKLPSTNNIRENNMLLLRHLATIDFVLSPLKHTYDYILIDSHPEISDVLRSIIYASDYCVSPVKLDLQSSIGVPSIIAEIRNVNEDVELIRSTVAPGLAFAPTRFAGAIGMMAREWGGEPKETERAELRRLRQTGGVFECYTTEGDGLRQAAAQRIPVFEIAGTNASSNLNNSGH